MKNTLIPDFVTFLIVLLLTATTFYIYNVTVFYQSVILGIEFIIMIIYVAVQKPEFSMYSDIPMYNIILDFACIMVIFVITTKILFMYNAFQNGFFALMTIESVVAIWYIRHNYIS